MHIYIYVYTHTHTHTYIYIYSMEKYNTATYPHTKNLKNRNFFLLVLAQTRMLLWFCMNSTFYWISCSLNIHTCAARSHTYICIYVYGFVYIHIFVECNCIYVYHEYNTGIYWHIYICMPLFNRVLPMPPFSYRLMCADMFRFQTRCGLMSSIFHVGDPILQMPLSFPVRVVYM